MDFRTLPFLGNPHVQTLLGNWPFGPVPRFGVCEYRILLPDGDSVVLHDSVPNRWVAGGPIALLLHGLGGSHRSGHLIRMASALLKRGVRAVRLDLRGAGRGAAHARKLYHGGTSDDVRIAAAMIYRRFPTSPLVVIGMSLGGNIALKLAGEAATDPVPGLERVAAVSPPIDLARSAAMLALPQNSFYERFFVRTLIGQVERQHRHHPDLARAPFTRETTLRMFDDLYTAPRSGFVDALDYYRQSSSLPLIAKIEIPTLILTARDDPFVAVEPFETLPKRPPLEVQITEKGGHLAFLGPDGAGGLRWAERRVIDWIAPRSLFQSDRGG